MEVKDIKDGLIIANRRVTQHKLVEIGVNEMQKFEVSVYVTAEDDLPPWDPDSNYDWDRQEFEDANAAIAHYIYEIMAGTTY